MGIPPGGGATAPDMMSLAWHYVGIRVWDDYERVRAPNTEL